MALPSSNVIKLPTPEERDRTKLRNALRETAVATGVAIHTVLEAEFRYMGVEGHCKKDGIVNYVISHQTLAKHLGYPRAAALEPHIETAEARFGKVEQIMRKASSGLGRPALHVMLPPEHACFVLELTKGRKAARVLADLRRAFLELYLAEGVTKDARLELNMNYVRALRQQRNDARHEAAQVKAALSAAQTEMKSLDAQVQQLICKLNEARAAQDAMKAAAKPRFIAGARVTGKYALPGELQGLHQVAPSPRRGDDARAGRHRPVGRPHRHRPPLRHHSRRIHRIRPGSRGCVPRHHRRGGRHFLT
jgi:hypothetical protein